MIIILIFNLPTSSELADFLVFLVIALLLLGAYVAFLKCKGKVLLKDSHIDFHTILYIYRPQSYILYFCARENLKLSIAGQTFRTHLLLHTLQRNIGTITAAKCGTDLCKRTFQDV